MKDTAGENESKKSKAVQLPDMPSPWQRYANYILIPLIIGLSVFLLVRFRMNANAEARLRDQQELTAVRARLHDWRVNDYALMLGDEQYAVLRDSTYTEVGRLIDSILKNTKEPTIRAEATLARGDLNWLMAVSPVSSRAATQPSLAPSQTPDAFLSAAEKAYNEVIDGRADSIGVQSARFGLAAIHENRGQWDEANKLYQLIADDDNAPQSFRNHARARMEIVKLTREPRYITNFDLPTETPDEPTTAPTTAPAATTSTAPAATRPATLPTTR